MEIEFFFEKISSFFQENLAVIDKKVYNKTNTFYSNYETKKLFNLFKNPVMFNGQFHHSF